MTREEAIEILSGFGIINRYCSEDAEALDMAIKALEQEPDTWSLEDAREDFVDDVYNTLDFLPTNNEANQIIDSFDRVTSDIKQQPCEDCISRADVLDLAKKGVLISNSNYQSVCKAINELPSVTPTRKKGANRMDDSISRQAVYEQINCWIGSGEYRYTSATDYLIKRIADISSDLKNTNKWIPVREKLPDKTGWYLVTFTNSYGDVAVCEMSYRKPENYWTDKNISKKALDNDEVLAWMPLPEIYKAESEEK